MRRQTRSTRQFETRRTLAFPENLKRRHRSVLRIEHHRRARGSMDVRTDETLRLRTHPYSTRLGKRREARREGGGPASDVVASGALLQASRDEHADMQARLNA